MWFLYIINKCNASLIRHYSTKKLIKNYDIGNMRNIGILAHIDAGKTTTTERMLFYSGSIKQMGEVHHGNTVTDFMEQERDRGITIKSAAVTFLWKTNQFNLIDTPGHIDFTMEVEQTLNVLDGAVIVLDASAGVEAQTLTVWRQADRYKIPRIIYVNKMDRLDADLKMCCNSIEQKFDCPTLCLHIPILENNKFAGIVDILTLEKTIWNTNKENQFTKTALQESDGKIWESAKEARTNIIDTLSGTDDNLANIIIESENLDNIKTNDIVLALRNTVISQKAVPVFCGSSYKNIGVQPLMDAIILYLPSPNERNKHFSAFENNLCARAFKIIHDKQRGPLVFFRIYAGQFLKGQKIYNIQQEISEQTGKLLIAYADDYEEIEMLDNGNIAVVSGLKKTITGDLITTSSSIVQKVKNKMEKSSVVSKDTIEDIFDVGAKIPEPVFFCSIEPPSLTYQAPLEQALIELQREDPSLRVTHESETGQTVLSGMGELHLEIIRDRILKEYKIEADLGPLQISYREAPITKVKTQLTTETKIGNSKQSVTVHLSLIPMQKGDGKCLLKLDKTPDAASSIASIIPRHMTALKQGIEVGVSHGPKVGSPIINTHIMLHMLTVGRGTSDTMIAAAVTQCIQKLLKESGTSILEPIMYLEIVTPEDYLSTVLGDLCRRRAVIQNVTIKGNNKMVVCETPLSELMGYSTTLRTITSGTGNFAMEFLEYKNMSTMDETKAIESVRGF